MCIVHRDLKPTNVALDITGIDAHVRIIDFGAAIQCADPRLIIPKDARNLCTPGFWQPWARDEEIWDGRRADVFSFGVIMWSILARHCMPPVVPIDWARVRSCYTTIERYSPSIDWAGSI